MKPTVGSLYSLKVPCLGNPEGTLGVCYEVYRLGDFSTSRTGEHEGFSFIFQNGNYDGFSRDEVDMFLEHVATDFSVTDYRFINVMKLSEDFKNEKLGIVSKVKEPSVFAPFLRKTL
jgi:hypothetical protein